MTTGAQLLGEPRQAGFPLLRLPSGRQRARVRAPDGEPGRAGRHAPAGGHPARRDLRHRTSGGNGAQRPREARTGARKGETGETTSPGPDPRPGPPERRKKGTGGGKGDPAQQAARLRPHPQPIPPVPEGAGLAPELVDAFGLGFCDKGIMAGRVCIPIHNADGQIVAYAGRWVGPLEDLPEGKGKYELPAGFRKDLELFNLHRVEALQAPGRGRGLLRRDPAAWPAYPGRGAHGYLGLGQSSWNCWPMPMPGTSPSCSTATSRAGKRPRKWRARSPTSRGPGSFTYPMACSPIPSTGPNSSDCSGAGKGSCVWRRKPNYGR